MARIKKYGHKSVTEYTAPDELLEKVAESNVNGDLDSSSAETTMNDQNSEATLETAMPDGEQNQPHVNFELMPGVVTVNESELNELIEQNITMKTEIGQLVSLFKIFEGLISGKSNVASLVMLLPKLMNNPEIGKQIEEIQPIIEKYTENQ